MRNLPHPLHFKKGTAYFKSFEDARIVQNYILNRHPAARIVAYKLGFAVQAYKSGPYYPECFSQKK